MTSGVVVRGYIKWFDPRRKYGFVRIASSEQDVLLHENVLFEAGRSSVSEGLEVTIEVIETARGMQVSKVLYVHPNTDELRAPILDLEGSDFKDLGNIPIVPARVKWFDHSKGIGFANKFGVSADIFIHIGVLKFSGFSSVTAGEAVGIRVVSGPRGPIAAHFIPWTEIFGEFSIDEFQNP